MRKALIAAGGLTLTLTMGACGVGDGKYQDTASLVRAASASTAKEKSVAFTVSMRLGPIAMTGEGANSYADGEDPRSWVTMTFDMSSVGMGLGTMEFEGRQLGDDFYLRMPTDLPGLPSDPDRPWYKTSLPELLSSTGIKVDQYLKSSDPGTMLDMLKESGELVDTETGVSIGGRTTTKYSFEVDFDEVMKNFGTSMQDLPALAEVDLDAVPVDVYLDERDLPVRLNVDMREVVDAIMDSAGGQQNLPPGMSFDEAYARTDFTEWGVEVDVEPPPADQISDQPLPEAGG
jgi:hypothetical protein